MISKTPTQEAFHEIRNGAVNLIAIMRKFDKGDKTKISAWYEMVIQSKRIKDALKMMKEDI